jgi:predicted ATPase
MEGKRLLERLRLTNFLSYGPEGAEIDLQPLNVLIGPNGSGKSNLIEALSVLKAAPTDLEPAIRAAGGIAELCWKGGGAGEARGPILACVARRPPWVRRSGLLRRGQGTSALAYELALNPISISRGEAWFTYEVIEDKTVGNNPPQRYYSEAAGEPAKILVRRVQDGDVRGELQEMSWENMDPTQSILSQRKDPDQYPELTHLGQAFSQLYFFRNPNFGRQSPLRGPQRADLPRGFLLEDGSNLGMVLNQLLSQPATKRVLLDRLKQFDPDLEDIVTSVVAGTVETVFHERGLSGPIPSTRLSDGTLRYLCLLTILCNPEPPPLVCIEDPELGLHPDILCRVGELLIEASQRTQLIVTTHSDTLVSAFSEIPEAVVVCEKGKTGTSLRRLEREPLKEWLEKYSLGELWSMGETGGNP